MKEKKWNSSYIFIAIVCSVFLLGGIVFTAQMLYRNKQRNIAYVREASEQRKASVVKQILSDWEMLKGVSVCFGSLGIMGSDELVPVLQKINDQNSFVQMGFIDLNGIGNIVDINGTIYENVDFSDANFFRSACQGRESISETIYSESLSTYVNYYGVPVEKDGQVIGVLCAVNHSDILRKLLELPIFNGNGHASLVSQDGTYVIRAESSPREKTLADTGAFTAKMLSQMASDVSTGTGGVLQFTLNYQQQWGVYIPVGFNDWYVLCVVPDAVLVGEYWSVVGVFCIVICAMLIFGFLALRINKVKQKSRLQFEYLTYVDTLTQKPNQAKFLLDAEQLLAQKPKEAFVVWYCDIDSFKYYNEIYGYEAGDRVLRQLSSFFETSSGSRDLFCRVTADNFVGIRFYKKQEDLVIWFQAISEEMEQYVLSCRESYHMGLCIGFCCVTGWEVLTVYEMLNRANVAQKTVKHGGHERYAFFTDDMRDKILTENEIEAHMNQALLENEFEIYVQPKVDIQNGNCLAGGEALVRWNSPDKGLISPGAFIPLFEKNGFIVRLDRYVFERVCQWLRDYLDEKGKCLGLAVNVSRVGLFQKDFLDYYVGIKQQYHIPDGILELEFTESVALEDHEKFRELIFALRKNGFICSLDDFGVGYSALNVLKDLPIQILKLDMAFFRGGGSQEKARIIVSNVLRMAGELEIQTVSEGVEYEEQVAFLRENHCEVVQGYVFAKPMPLRDYEEMLTGATPYPWDSGDSLVNTP